MNLLEKIKNLSPTQFENLIFDLVMLKGLKNAIWRTPGVDGGRDIEGNIISTDFSDAIKIEHWYIECKKYNSTIDWPTIYNKYAYAINHNVEYLLIVTTGVLSPRCKEEVTIYQNKNKMPIIRYWDGTLLPSIIERFPVVLVKFGLASFDIIKNNSLLPFLQISSNAIQAAYGRATSNDNVDPALEFSAAMVDLLLARLKEESIWGIELKRRFSKERDSYDWLTIDNDLELDNYDSYGLRALASAARFCHKMDRIILKKSEHSKLVFDLTDGKTSKVFSENLKYISILSNFEIFEEQNKITIEVRNGLN